MKRTATLICLVCLGVPVLCAALRPGDPEVRRITSGVADTVVTTTYRADDDARPGRTVVLVPGLLGSAFTFRKVAPALSDAGHDAVVIEPLGMGASARPRDADYSLGAQAERLGRALDSLGISNATFVCHSVGASICLRLALQRPSLVAGVISLNGGPDEAAATGGLRTALKLAPVIKLLGAERIMKNKVKDGLVESAADPSWVTADVIAGYTKPFTSVNAVLTGFRGMVNAQERLPLRPRLGEITAPVTLLVGAGKPGQVKTADLNAMVESLPGLVVDSVTDAGQYIQEENPGAVVRAVEAQLRISQPATKPARPSLRTTRVQPLR